MHCGRLKETGGLQGIRRDGVGELGGDVEKNRTACPSWQTEWLNYAIFSNYGLYVPLLHEKPSETSCGVDDLNIA